MLAPSVLFPGRFWDRNLHVLLVVLLFLFWPLRLFVRPSALVRSPVGIATLCLVAWLPITIIVSAEPSRSVEWAGYVALGVAVFAALIDWAPATRRPLRIAWILLVMGTTLAMIGPFLVGQVPDKFAILMATRPTAALASGLLGETLNPNVLAGALAMIVPVATAFAVGGGIRTWGRLLAALAALTMLAALIWTQSRGAYLAAFISLTMVGIALQRRRMGKAVVVGASTAIVVFAASYLATFSNAVSSPQSELVRRIQIWHRALLAIRDAPLTGIGFSQFDVVIPRLYPYDMRAGSPPPHAHNLFLQVSVDMGLAGLLIMAALWAAVVWSLVTLWQSNKHAIVGSDMNTVRTATAGAAAALAAMLVHGAVDAVLWSSKLAFMPWILYALVVDLWLMYGSRAHEATSPADMSESRGGS